MALQRGRQIPGLEPGLHDSPGDGQRYDVAPRTEELVKGGVSQAQRPTSELRPVSSRGREDLKKRDIAVARTREDSCTHVAITNTILAAGTVQRIDTAPKGRKDILIFNYSDVVIWVNTTNMVGADHGVPLAANSAAGLMDGGRLEMSDIEESVKFYATAATGTGNKVVVIETAR